jgi:hypothetical protein
MLSDNDVKEELSYAYMHAIASRAGFSCESVRKDRDSVDLHLCARGQLDPSSRLSSVHLAVQLKAHVLEPLPDEAFDFRLKRKNYDDLRAPSAMVPKILVIFTMPRDPARWVTLSEDELVIRRCAYWCSLLGLPESQNEQYQGVRVERKNILDGPTLRGLMLKVSREEAITHGS